MNFARLSKWLVGICLSRHGIRQYQSNYADGPAYITQCPIETGGSYIYEFTVNGQRGTFFYHAHINWLRATVHGALIVHPKKGLPPRYKDVVEEIPILIGKFIC
jgi:laccase